MSVHYQGSQTRVTVGVDSDLRITANAPSTQGAFREGELVTFHGGPRPSTPWSRIVSVAAIGKSAVVANSGSRISDLLFRHPWLLLALLLAPPLLWIGMVYVGSLLTLLLNSFYGLDDFSGLIEYEFTLSTYAQLLQRANFDIIVRSVPMAAAVTLASAVIAFPVSYYAARYARGKWKAFFYLAVMMPLWSSYLVKVYAWKLISGEGGYPHLAGGNDRPRLAAERLLALPVIGGPSLSISYIGMFLVFVYVWLPYMILPTQAALERVPNEPG